ncbi:Phytocyanin domain - like 10 [Theobroma cacao]|nr:Phytocyanin domain - like 10 [Theobroma cacao]
MWMAFNNCPHNGKSLNNVVIIHTWLLINSLKASSTTSKKVFTLHYIYSCRGKRKIYKAHTTEAERDRDLGATVRENTSNTERKMARQISIAALFVVLAAVVLQSTYAATYTVGNSTGWRIPPNTDFYDNWTDDTNFVVGDILVFDFTTGQHDVARMTETAYDACTTTNAIFTETTGPARIRLNTTGEHYFICTFSNHCASGQKLKVEVQNSTTASTPGSSPTTPSGTSSPPSSASSVVAALSLVLMSIALVLLC